MRNWSALLPVVLVVASACRDEPAQTASRPAANVPATKTDAPMQAPPPPRVPVADAAAAIESKRAEILQSPELRDLTFRTALVEPFVVFQEVDETEVRKAIDRYDERDRWLKDRETPGTAKPADLEPQIRWAEKADSFARREATLLAELDRRFRELFAQRLTLPSLQEQGRRISVVVFWNIANEVRARKASAAKTSPDVHDGARPAQPDVRTYLVDTFLDSNDELRCAEDRVQKAGDQWLLADCAGRLLREYAAIHRGRPLADDATEDAPLAPMWFKTGFPAWLGAVEVPRDRLEAPAGSDILHERIRLDCVAESRLDREMAEKWTLTELMKPLYNPDGLTRGERLSPGYGGKMNSLFECRAWALCHFLWNYDGGRYRERLIDFLGLYLDGKATSWAFAVDVMKRPSIKDWGELEMEYEWYWTKLLERKVGQTKYTHTWATPTTTPPEGTMEQDEEFLAWWKDTHAK